MSRILTGIQSTNIPHLGNILGAILPAIELSKDPKNESLFLLLIYIRSPHKKMPNSALIALIRLLQLGWHLILIHIKTYFIAKAAYPKYVN